MASWTAQKLMDHVQHLIGEPVGGFYNIQHRLDEMNRAQEEMVADCRALTASTTLTTTASTRTVSLPSGFLMFSQTAPRYNDGGDYSEIKIISANDADRLYPNWQDAADLYDTGTPRHAWVTNQDTLNLLPLPDGGTIELTYVKSPADMVDYDDLPFDGNTSLNRFAVGLAQKVANMIMLPRSPQYATVLNNMYIEEIKKMRDFLRRNPQRPQFIDPGGRHSRSLEDRIEEWRND